MTEFNPYESPRSKRTHGRPWLLLSGIAAVVGCAVAGGLAGMGIGIALGTWVPNYYRSVFSNGTAAGFDPVAVGLGQGLTQGFVLGALVGLALAGMFYWHVGRKLSS